MKTMLRLWVKIWDKVAITILVLLGVLGIGLIASPFIFLCIASQIGVSAGIPQDCMGVTFSVKGYVTDEEARPIVRADIHAFNRWDFENTPFDVTITSDEHGYFETKPVTSFACTPFEVEIAAANYEKQTLNFYPPGEGLSDELPKLISVHLRRESVG